MPDPDPQPPQPHPVSTARWLLLLTPSLLPMVASPLLAQAYSRAILEPRGEVTGSGIVDGLIAGAIFTPLCFAFGFLLQKWRWGKVKNSDRAFRYGMLILVVNNFIFFGRLILF